MFSQEQNEYLDKFFAAHEYPSVSWIHDLGQGRYGFAAQSLLSEAEHAPELSSKHVCNHPHSRSLEADILLI